MDAPAPFVLDALLPPAMARRAEQIGVQKANMDAVRLFVLAVLAGAFIALGAVFSTTVAAGTEGQLPFGVTRLLAGTVFSLGLILVLVGGAELFTGNTLIVMAWAGGKVSTGRLLRNWGIVYVGNFAGALATAVLVCLSEQYRFGGGAVGVTALKIAQAKVSLGFTEAVALGILCNVLVCLAVWLTYSARTSTDRVLVTVPPIAAFVAAGFEHSIANMYLVPTGLLIRSVAPAAFWSMTGMDSNDLESLSWTGFVLRNLIPVTMGNLIGGAGLVGLVYWAVYLRPDVAEGIAQPDPTSHRDISAPKNRTLKPQSDAHASEHPTAADG